MLACVVRVVLGGIVLGNNEVTDKVKNETCLIAKAFFEKVTESIFFDDALKGNMRTDADGAAAQRSRCGAPRSNRRVGEMLQEVLVRNHLRRIVRIELADDTALGDIELSFGVVDTVDFIKDIATAALLFERDFALDIRNRKSGIEIHNQAIIEFNG